MSGSEDLKLLNTWVEQFVPKEDVGVFDKIKRAIDLLPDIDLGKDESGREIMLSCHILSRAVARVFNLKCIDGSYRFFYLSDYSVCNHFNCMDGIKNNIIFISCNHSWVLTKNQNIIDVYPIGVLGGPILISCNPLSPVSRLYFPMSTRSVSNGGFSKPSFQRSVKKIISEIRKVTKAEQFDSI
uniref:Uncharacterized protein n=1 Tax=candidate division CPR3 bacterium TaxID=2268181 RepID=A0A7C4R596_UNCC3